MAQQYNGDPLVIGLVNNMPDGALQMTERQFRGLLDEASGDIAVRLRLFSLPELPRADAAKAHIREHYEPFTNLATGRIDGLIVTGTEPRAPTLAEEPYWKSLTNLIDWAEQHTTSTIWSCLAAHAAVFHIDGVRRQKYPEKLSGLFECARASDHRLLENATARWCFPHSRHNDLPEEALTAKGYQVLSRSPVAGADMFIKQRKSLFVFADFCAANGTSIRRCRTAISMPTPRPHSRDFAPEPCCNVALSCRANSPPRAWKQGLRIRGARQRSSSTRIG